MKVYAWLIDFAHFRKNCPTGIIPEWMHKVTEHNRMTQHFFIAEYDASQFVHHHLRSLFYRQFDVHSKKFLLPLPQYTERAYSQQRLLGRSWIRTHSDHTRPLGLGGNHSEQHERRIVRMQVLPLKYSSLDSLEEFFEKFNNEKWKISHGGENVGVLRLFSEKTYHRKDIWLNPNGPGRPSGLFGQWPAHHRSVSVENWSLFWTKPHSVCWLFAPKRARGASDSILD